MVRRASTRQAAARRRQVNFHSAPPPHDLKKRDQQTKPGNPTEHRATRSATSARTASQARVSARCSSPRSGPREPLRARRRRTRPTVRSSRGVSPRTTSSSKPPPSATRREAEIKRDEAKKTNPGGAAKQQTQANQADAIMKAARKKAIEYYTLISRTSTRTTRQLDEVLYYLAYEYEQANDLEERAQGLLRAHPEGAADSKYIPNAYLAFGELFFNEAQGDPSQVGSRRAGATRRSSSTRRRTTRCSATPGTSSRYVYWNKGESRQVAQRVQEDDRVRRQSTSQLPERREARRRRAPRHHPGLRARRATRRRPTTSCTTSRATQRARTRRRSR